MKWILFLIFFNDGSWYLDYSEVQGSLTQCLIAREELFLKIGTPEHNAQAVCVKYREEK